MGHLLSRLFGSAEPENYDVANPKTGLTPRQADLVRKSWHVVKLDVKGNGMDLFLKMFDKHPEYQQMFRSFSQVPRADLPTNGRLLGHATSVMYALTSLVDQLDDPQCLSELLHKIGESHIPRKLKAQHFQNLSLLMMELLEEKLGPKIMTIPTKEAWQKTLEVMNSLIVAALENK